MSDPVFVGATKALRVISNSEARCFRKCPRKHHYSYRLRRRRLHKPMPLRFGTLFHNGLEAWWNTVDLDASIVAMRESDRQIDPYEMAKAEALLIGYHAWWVNEPLDVLAVEQEFRVPLVNPKTGAESRTFVLGGKIDAIVRTREGRVLVVEHKTASDDLAPESDYWRKLRLDAQISTYIAAAKSLGFDAEGCLYDVIGKPTKQPHMATPVEKREYTQRKDKSCPECKKKSAGPAPHVVDGLVCEDGRIVTDPGGRLYKNQRDTDETPDEYRSRILDDIKANPRDYYARSEIVRLADEQDDAAADLWATARALREAELLERYPRHVESCIEFGRTCDFWEACTGQASIDNDMIFRTAETPHEELTPEKKEGAAA